MGGRVSHAHDNLFVIMSFLLMQRTDLLTMYLSTTSCSVLSSKLKAITQCGFINIEHVLLGVVDFVIKVVKSTSITTGIEYSSTCIRILTDRASTCDRFYEAARII